MEMSSLNTNADSVPMGYSALVQQYQLKVVPHFRSSYLAAQGRISSCQHGLVEKWVYPKKYAIQDLHHSLQHLEFAIKYDGINLEILTAFFQCANISELTRFIQEKPTGKYRRKIWFLYEFLMGDLLDIGDAKHTPYIDLLDDEKYYTGKIIRSKRQAINNNLLGGIDFCPFVRKTQKLIEFESKKLNQQTEALIESIDPAVLSRATSYLYTKETQSSFAIEHINPDRKRIERFVTLLEEAGSIYELNKDMFLSLQNNIVDEPYRDFDYRKNQNYVGELTRLYQQRIHYISPKPEDISQLMQGYLQFEKSISKTHIHPVVLAAIIGFGFVFLHPFEDGNGRIHRFLIHYILAKTGFVPENLIFPISSIMLKDRKKYDETLETFSKPLMSTINSYQLSDTGELSVLEKTKSHYQYIDYTKCTEYLFMCIEKTAQDDFKEELAFIQKYDQAKSAIQNIIDMPDIKVDGIIRCIAQNQGNLGKKMRRTYFQELSDETIKNIEEVIRKIDFDEQRD